MTNDELTQAIKHGTSRILRAFELKLDLIAAEIGNDPMLSEAKRLLSDAIVTAETNSKVEWMLGPGEKILRVEQDAPLLRLENISNEQ